jgi:hypothetical protein
MRLTRTNILLLDDGRTLEEQSLDALPAERSPPSMAQAADDE